LFRSTANDTIQYQAFEVFPSSSTPAFRPVGSLSFGPRGFPVCFSGDLLVIISDGIVTVWNAAQDSWARWQTGIIGEDVGDLIDILNFTKYVRLSRFARYSAVNAMETLFL